MVNLLGSGTWKASRGGVLAGIGVVTLSLVGMPRAAVAATNPTLVAVWHMDEPQGSATMKDSSGAHHDGAIGSGVTAGVVSDDGSTGYRLTQPRGVVVVRHSPDLNPGGMPITLATHLQVPANLPVGDYNVLQKGTATATGGAYKLEIYASRAGAPKFGFPACAFNGAAGKNRVYGPSSVADGRWHEVVCHLTANQAYVTIDGRSGPVAVRRVSTIANTVDVTVGAKPNGTHGYVGLLDEVSIRIG